MARRRLPISNGFYVSDALPISNQRCVNFRPNVPQTATITQDNLFSTEGLIQLATAGSIPTCRGAHVMDSIPYFVIGNNLYRLTRVVAGSDENFTLDDMGVIVGVERVFMADNGTQLCIVAPPDAVTTGKSYIFTTTPDTLAEITDANFDGPAASVVYANGYFSFHKSDGKKFFHSPLKDGRGTPSGTAYDALDFSNADADPDQIRGQVVYKNQLYVLGSETTQIFRDIGRTPSTFAAIPGAVIDVGLTAPHSIQKFGGGFAFVGAGVNESPAVWHITGSGRSKLSTTAIDNELSKLSDPSTIFSWVYAESGGYFYGITVPETTYVYDVANSRWHERQSKKGKTQSQFRASHMIDAYDRIIVGDTQDGRVGYLDKNTYTEYTSIIKRFVTSQPFDADGNPVFVASMEAVVESGVGLTNDVVVDGLTGGEDPKITYSWSDNGGRKFVGNLSRSMGKIGEYTKRPIWNRCGRFPLARSVRFEVASPTKATLIKVMADI